jgi:hypothetical protein
MFCRKSSQKAVFVPYLKKLAKESTPHNSRKFAQNSPKKLCSFRNLIKWQKKALHPIVENPPNLVTLVVVIVPDRA